MSQLTLSQIERRAIWQAGGCACAYCGKPLRFRELEIDHIIPQSLEGDAAAWSRLREEQGLPNDFDVNGYANLAPACPDCNGRKSAQSLQAGRLAIELTNAKRLRRQVEALIVRFTKQAEAERIRFLIAAGLDAGRLSQADVRDILHDGWDTPHFRGEPESLFAGLDLQGITEQDVERIRNTRTGPDDGLEMRASDDSRRTAVSTLAEYDMAVAEALYAHTTYDRHMEYLWFKRPIQILNLLRKAQIADESYIRSPKRGVFDIALLPAPVLYCGPHESQEAFDREREVLFGKTVQDLVRANEVRIEDVDSFSITLIWHNCRTHLTELMRADVDGDGTEDLVISWGGGPVDGTFFEAGVSYLRRESAGSLFEVCSPG